MVFEYCCRSLTSNIGWLGLVGIIVGEGEMFALEFVRWYNSVRGYCTALIDDAVSNRSSGWAIILLSWFCAVYSTEMVRLWVEGLLLLGKVCCSLYRSPMFNLSQVMPKYQNC